MTGRSLLLFFAQPGDHDHVDHVDYDYHDHIEPGDHNYHDHVEHVDHDEHGGEDDYDDHDGGLLQNHLQ